MIIRETLSLPNFDSANIAEELQLTSDTSPNQAITPVSIGKNGQNHARKTLSD